MHGDDFEASVRDVAGAVVELGRQFWLLAAEQSQWSQATFGTDAERGPVGTLRHLAKEADEAREAAEKYAAHRDRVPDDWLPYKAAADAELADCLILVLDAARRHGLSPAQLVAAARQKMVVNRSRKWPTGVPADRPVEHVREGGGA